MSHDITHSHIPKTYTIMTIRKEEVGFPILGVRHTLFLQSWCLRCK